MHPRQVLHAGGQRWCKEQPEALLSVQPQCPGGMLWTHRPLLWIPGGQAMHHHQAESGMKDIKWRETNSVARRHWVTEIMKLVGNEEKIIPGKKRRPDYSYWLLQLLLISSIFQKFQAWFSIPVCLTKKWYWCWRSVAFSSRQVIGMLPGKNGQAPYVTCGAKVIPFCLSQFGFQPIHSYCASLSSAICHLSLISILFNVCVYIVSTALHVTYNTCVCCWSPLFFFSFFICCINLPTLRNTKLAKMNG